MEKSPAFQFYPKDLLADPVAMGLGNELLGVYLKLLCFDWMEDGLPDDDSILMELTNLRPLQPGEEDSRLKNIRRKFVEHPTKEGFITNPRLQKERAKQASYVERGRAGGIASAKQKAKQKPSKAEAKANTPSSSPSSSPTPKIKTKPLRPSKPGPEVEDWDLHFETLWELYPEKKGKHDALRKFKAQVKTLPRLEDIKMALRNYKKDMENIRRDHPDRAWLHGSTWFNCRWEDFIDYKSPGKEVTPRKPDIWTPPNPKECIPPGQLKKLFKDFKGTLKSVDV